MIDPHALDLDALENDLMRDEGLRLKPYRDTTGHLTIGYGHNLDANGITPLQARRLLQDDLWDVVTQLKGRLPAVWEPLDGVRKRVVAEMGFQLWVDALLRDWRPTLQLIADGDYSEAAKHMRAAKVYQQAHDRWERLARLMERGE